MTNAVTGVTMEFTYNHAGLRTKKVKKVKGVLAETTEYILSGKNVVGLTHTDYASNEVDTMRFFYDAQNCVAKVNYNGTIYVYARNLQGDVVGLLDNSGAKVVEYKYDAWGKTVSVAGALTGTLGERNLFRYRGYNYDEETGLYYLRSRYYSPVVGRFVNEDGAIAPEVLGANLFAYCLNSPLSRVDTSGYKGENIFRRAGNWFGDIFSQIGDEIRYQTQIQTEVNILMAKAADEKISAAEDWIEKKVSDVGNTVGGWWNGNAKPWIKQKWADTGAFIKDALHAQQQADILSAQMTYHAGMKICNWAVDAYKWTTASIDNTLHVLSGLIGGSGLIATVVSYAAKGSVAAVAGYVGAACTVVGFGIFVVQSIRLGKDD